MFIIVRDVRERTHYSQRVEHGVPGDVVCPLMGGSHVYHYGGGGGGGFPKGLN